jgi:hypothetical protein
MRNMLGNIINLNKGKGPASCGSQEATFLERSLNSCVITCFRRQSFASLEDSFSFDSTWS